MSKMSIFVTKKDERVCENCRYFHQHYVRDGCGFSKVFAGHCTYPRLKDRENSDSCDYFERRGAH